VAGGRFLSADQIWQILDPDPKKRHTIQVALKKLRVAGYLDEAPKHDELERKPGKNPYIYALGLQGATFLGLPPKNNDVEKEIIDHDLMSGNIYAVIYSACREREIPIKARDIEPTDLPKLYVKEISDSVRKSTKPDLMFNIKDILYIEAETGKNVIWRKKESRATQSSFVNKIYYYFRLYDLARAGKYPYFRVLTVCRSFARLSQYRELCKAIRPKGKGMDIFWFAIEKNITLKYPHWALFDPIWFTPSSEEPRILLN